MYLLRFPGGILLFIVSLEPCLAFRCHQLSVSLLCRSVFLFLSDFVKLL